VKQYETGRTLNVEFRANSKIPQFIQIDNSIDDGVIEIVDANTKKVIGILKLLDTTEVAG
jgi:hypothetical protein